MVQKFQTELVKFIFPAVRLPVLQILHFNVVSRLNICDGLVFLNTPSDPTYLSTLLRLPPVTLSC